MNNDTPLHFAAENQNVQAIEILLKYGANPNIGGRNGQTRNLQAGILLYQIALLIVLDLYFRNNTSNLMSREHFWPVSCHTARKYISILVGNS